jgi:hypothetical protein
MQGYGDPDSKFALICWRSHVSLAGTHDAELGVGTSIRVSRSRNFKHLNSGDEPVICGHGAARLCALLLDFPSFQLLFAQDV